MTEQLFDVFLAHHSADKPFVREINTNLKQRGLKTWIDEEQISPGRSFQQEIQQAIPRVKTAAIILGKDGIGRWQNWEIQAFFSQLVKANKIVIPVLLPGLDEVPEDLPFLQQLRWINFKNVEDSDSIGLLIWGITGERPQQELKDKPLSMTSTETVQPSSFPYERVQDPVSSFSPIAWIEVSNPSSSTDRGVNVQAKAIIDTVAGLTSIPESIIDELGGLSHTVIRVSSPLDYKNIILKKLYKVTIKFGEKLHEVEVIGVHRDYAIIGRDILNQHIIILDSPNEVWSIK
jgi:hypothetical protein